MHTTKCTFRWKIKNKAKNNSKYYRTKGKEYNNDSNLTLSQTPKTTIYTCMYNHTHTYTHIYKIYIYIYIFMISFPFSLLKY